MAGVFEVRAASNMRYTVRAYEALAWACIILSPVTDWVTPILGGSLLVFFLSISRSYSYLVPIAVNSCAV